MSALRDAALEYAARGFHVFPCLPRSKHPVRKPGFYMASTNPETIKRLWRRADCNVAIRTGASSGAWVLDIDHKTADGEARLRDLEARHGPLPPTPESITGTGGRHLWFRYTGPVSCSEGRVAPGIDVRADGGYAMAPPSVHPSGRRYEWSVDSVAELAVAPDWLLQLTRKRPVLISERALALVPRPRSAGTSDAYGLAALDRECADLAAIAPGTRNNALNVAAFRLFQLVGGGELDGHTVAERLVEACHRNGLIKDDGLHSVVATIRSGRRAGLRFPRARSGGAT